MIACAAIAFWAYRGSVMQGEADLAVGLAVVGLESLIVWGGLYAFSLRRNGSMKINLLYLAGVILCGSLGFWAGAASVA